MTDTTRPHTETTSVEPILGNTVGRYLLLDQIGRGGCGDVYRAFDPMLDRTVAIKVLHAQSVSDAEILHEGRILARFSHPNVLPVFDVGIEEGRVFLAMEHIEGGDLRGWIDAPPPARAIEALAGAARGLAAAHDAGIVHGDVKAANVLLGPKGRLLISDFGIARTATMRSMGSTDPEAAGTPAYMAPELADGPASAASDQYSFCIMAAAALEGGRIPPRSAAALRRGRAEDPAERWPSMEALADALDRRGAHRSRWIFGAAALAAVGGVGVASSRTPDACSTVADSVGEQWDASARAAVEAAIIGSDAPEAAHTWTRVESSLDDYVDALGQMRTGLCSATQQRGASDDAIRRREVCLDRAQFHVGAVVRALRTSTDRVDRLVDGLPSLEQCVSPREALPPEDVSAEVAKVEDELVEFSVLLLAGRIEEASELYASSRPRADATGHPPLLARADLSGAWLYRETDRDEEALPLLEGALATAIEHGLDRAAFKAATGLGSLLSDRLGRTSEGLVYARLGVHYAASIGSSAADEGNARTALGAALAAAGNTEGALEQLERALELYTEAHGPADRRVAMVHSDLSIDLRRSGRLEEAEAHRRTALEIRMALFGESHPVTLRSRTNLAALLPGLGKSAEGEREARTVLALQDASGHSTAYDRMMVSMALAHALLEQDRVDEAVLQYRTVLGLVDPSRGRHRSMQGIAVRNLASALSEQGKHEEAERTYARAVEHLRAALPENHPRVASLRLNRAANFAEQGSLDDARAQANLALEALESVDGVSPSELSEAACAVGTIADQQGDAVTARTMLQRCVELRRENGGQPLAEAELALAKALDVDGA